MPIPVYPPIRAAHDYLISPAVLKSGLESVVRGGRISELSSPVLFPDCPILQQLFGWLYCQYHGLNARAAEILDKNAATILSAILKADRERMAVWIALEPDDIAWKESNEEIQQGIRFRIEEEEFQDLVGETMLGETAYRMTSNGQSVIFTQLYNAIPPGVDRDQCVLDVSLNHLKMECLRAYIDARHQSGCIADLTDFDLSSICVCGIDFNGTRMQAAHFSELVTQRIDIDFTDVELTGSDTVREIPDTGEAAKHRKSASANFNEIPMPPSIPSVTLIDHHVSTATLRHDLQFSVNGRELPNLDLNISPDFPLYSVLNCCYHFYLGVVKGVDVEAQRLFMANRDKVLKALLKAACEPTIPQLVTIKSTDGLVDQFDITFNDQASTVTLAQRFYTHGDRNGLTRYEHSAQDIWALSSLDAFKKNCLIAYINSAHEKGEIADLSDIDLSELDTRDIQFDRTKISAKDLRHFANQERRVSLIESEVAGNLPGAGIMFVDLKIDKKLALQLIGAGADKRGVLDAFLKTERASNRRTKIDLGGFDLRGVDLTGFDFRDVNFKNALVRKTGAVLSIAEKEQRLILDRRVFNWISHLRPDQIERPVSEKRRIPVYPSFVGLAKDVDFRLSNCLPLPESLDQDLTWKNGNVQMLSKAGAKKPNFKIFTRSDSVVSMQRSVFFEMLRYEFYLNFGSEWLDIEGNESGSKNAKMTDEALKYRGGWQPEPVIEFVNSLPCNVGLRIELARFLIGASDEPLSSPLEAYLTEPGGLSLKLQITLDHLNLPETFAS